MANSYGAISVLNTATKIADVNNFRRGINIFNGGSETLYLGMDNLVTTVNGFPVLANATFFNNGYLDLYRGAIWGIVATGPIDVRFFDWIEV